MFSDESSTWTDVEVHEAQSVHVRQQPADVLQNGLNLGDAQRSVIQVPAHELAQQE